MKNKLYSGILMVTGSFPPDITGGGIQCSNLLKNLPVGLRNYFCITTTRDKNLPVKQIEDWGIVYRVFINPQSKISKIKSFFEIIRIFLGIKNKIKIIHLHSFTSKSVLFVLLASIFKKKIILKLTSMGDDDPFSIKKRGFGNILYRFYKCADVFISVSPGLTEVFKRSELRDKPLVIIPNGVDIFRFKPLLFGKEKIRTKLQLPVDKKVMLSVCFFSKDKGVDLIYAAWKKLLNEFKLDVYLTIIGSTDTGYHEISKDLVENIKADIKENKLENRIGLIEKVYNIEEYFQACDVFVSASKREGLPNVILEAMACGIPVVAARIKGITGYLIDGGVNGLLFDLDNADEFSEKLLSVLNNPSYSKEIGMKARCRIEHEFSFSKISKKYDNLYDKILNFNND